MDKGKRLIKNTIIIALGDFFPKIIGLILLPIYTTWLTKYEYGKYDYINSIISILLPIITLQIERAVFRFLIDTDDSDKMIIISNGFYFILFSDILSLTLVLLVSRLFNINTNPVLLILIILYFIIRGFIELARHICRGQSNFKLYSLSIVIVAVFNLILAPIFLIILKMGLEGLLLVLTISDCLSFIYVLFKGNLFKKISYRYIDRKVIISLLKYSLPLVPNKISEWVVNLSDRLVISAFLGFNMNAVYSIANKVPSLYSSFYNTFNLAWQESASANSNDEDYFKRVFDYLFRFMVFANLLLISVTPLMYKLFISSQYENAKIHSLILYYALFFSSLSSFLGGILIAKKNTKILGFMTLVAAIINILINLLLVNKIGLFASSLSTLIAYLVLFLQRYKYVNDNITEIKLPKKSLFISCIISIIVLLLSYFESWIHIILSLLFVLIYIRIYCFDIYKNIVLAIVKRIEKG